MSIAFKLPVAAVVAAMVLFAVNSVEVSAADSNRSGQFSGRSGHTTTGGVTVVKQGNKVVVTLAASFHLDGAPDPYVGFGKNGRFIKSTQIGKLKKLNGQQSYAVPEGVDIDAVNEVYIWCRKFSVPLGAAKLR